MANEILLSSWKVFPAEKDSERDIGSQKCAQMHDFPTTCKGISVCGDKSCLHANDKYLTSISVVRRKMFQGLGTKKLCFSGFREPQDAWKKTYSILVREGVQWSELVDM